MKIIENGIEREMTPEEVAEFEDMQSSINLKPSYKELRAAAYPPMQDYIDGLVKGDQAQMQAYIDKCLAIKAAIPKEQV